MKAASVRAFLACLLLMAAPAIDAETIFDTVDLTSDTWAYAIHSGAVDPTSDVAFAFDVPETSDFALEFLELRLGLSTAAGPNEIRVVVHEDAEFEPGAVLEEFLLIDQMPPYSSETSLLRVDSLAHPVLRSGNRYWVAAYGPEQVPYIFSAAWFINSNWTVPHIPHAVSLDQGAWIVDEAEAAEFRVSAVPVPACSDGLDNDGDGFIDYPDDPGCQDLQGARENPQCQDGINNDPGQDSQGLIDHDGGQSLYGACEGGSCPLGVSDPDGDGVADPDPQCIGKPWKDQERKPSTSCGLSSELALLLPPLMWLYLRRWRSI